MMGGSLFIVALNRWTDEGRVALTFYGKSWSRFCRHDRGIHSGQLIGGDGGETGDFRGRKAAVYCRGITKWLLGGNLASIKRRTQSAVGVSKPDVALPCSLTLAC